MRRGRMGHRVTHLHAASSRGLQGGFGMGRVEVPPHPSATRGSRVLQCRVWVSRVLQLFLLFLWCRHRGSQRLLPWVRGFRGLQGGFGMGRAEVPPHPSAIRGSRVLQGRVWGSVAAAALSLSVVQAQGQPEAAALGQGCQGQGQGQGQGGSAPPPARRSPLPSLRVRAGRAQERGSATRGGRAARGADRQGRPSQRRDAAARLPPRGGGLLSLGFTRQVQSSGGGGRPTPHSRTCICGRG